MVGHAVTRWQADPHAAGSYSYLPVGADPADRAALAEPNAAGTVFWCGEHCCCDYPATVHGAFLSGKTVARQVLGEPDLGEEGARLEKKVVAEVLASTGTGADGKISIETFVAALKARGELEPEPEPVAAAAGPGATESRASIQDKGWSQLTSAQRQGAEALGFTKQMWDNNKEPKSCNKAWAKLTPEQQAGARAIGETALSWDDSSSSDSD